MNRPDSPHSTQQAASQTGLVPIVPLAVSMGDPAGIAPELALKAWLASRHLPHAAFVWIGDPMVLATAALTLGLAVPQVRVDHPGQAVGVFSKGLPVLSTEAPCGHIIPGTPDRAHAACVIEAISIGVRLCQSGEASGLVTLPIAKAPLAQAGFGFPGHTEFLGSLAPSRRHRAAAPMMMLVGRDLRVALATIHIPLAKVAESLSQELLAAQIACLADALRNDFGIAKPRIAVCGLNPHAGEGGVLGQEEADVIAPAITTALALARQEAAGPITITGPHPADVMFHAEARASYDAALTMYHDQGLIPLKMLSFWDGVNVTIGLPVVRTSPDHGTAFDIAGRGIARPDSTLAAMALARGIAVKRASQNLVQS
jgi:4-hydroxythreonine-4-phosphate dehydrogenase